MVVFLHLNAFLIQISLHTVTQCPLLNKQHGAVLRQVSVGNGNRIAFHITAPDIEKPHQIIQLRQKEAVCPLLLQLLHHVAALLFKASACNLLVQNGDLSRRKRRPARPDAVGQILVISDGNLFVCQLFLVFFSGLNGDHPAVKAQGLALLHILLQKFRDGGNALVSHTEQRDRGSLQLMLRLDKISAIRPQPGAILPHQKRPAGACKTAEIFPYLEVIIHIFGIVKIRGGNHVIVDAVFLHLRPQRRKSALNDCVFHFLSRLSIVLFILMYLYLQLQKFSHHILHFTHFALSVVQYGCGADFLDGIGNPDA